MDVTGSSSQSNEQVGCKFEAWFASQLYSSLLATRTGSFLAILRVSGHYRGSDELQFNSIIREGTRLRGRIVFHMVPVALSPIGRRAQTNL
jgi:hypothetical protein